MQEIPQNKLYDLGMVKHAIAVVMGIEAARKKLGERVDASTENGEHTVITRHGRPCGVIVPIDWYRDARDAVGNPTEF